MTSYFDSIAAGSNLTTFSSTWEETTVDLITTKPNEVDNYNRPFDDTAIAVTASIIFTFLVIGLIANSITIAVIMTYKPLHSNVFMRFILSLCVSDLISALISWLFLYRRTWGFDEWSPIPDFLCTFYWAADIMTSYVTALHILSFAVLRLISIKFPVLYNQMTMKHANVWIGVIWLLCFFCGFVPSLTIFGPGAPDRSSSLPNARWPACTILVSRLNEYRIFQNVTFPLFLYVPTFGVVLVCVYIIAVVRVRAKSSPSSNKQEKQQKKERQAVLQLMLIIVAFLIGYIPFTAYEFWSIQDFPNEQYYYEADYWFGMIEYLFLRFSECLNPFFYNLGSAKMRKYTKHFLKKKLCCCLTRLAKDVVINIPNGTAAPKPVPGSDLTITPTAMSGFGV